MLRVTQSTIKGYHIYILKWYDFKDGSKIFIYDRARRHEYKRGRNLKEKCYLLMNSLAVVNISDIHRIAI